MPWSNSPRWKEIIDEKNEELLGATLNQISSIIQTITLKPNETIWEKDNCINSWLINKSIFLINSRTKRRQSQNWEIQKYHFLKKMQTGT